jgi:hypothetical protein
VLARQARRRPRRSQPHPGTTCSRGRRGVAPGATSRIQARRVRAAARPAPQTQPAASGHDVFARQPDPRPRRSQPHPGTTRSRGSRGVAPGAASRIQARRVRAAARSGALSVEDLIINLNAQMALPRPGSVYAWLLAGAWMPCASPAVAGLCGFAACASLDKVRQPCGCGALCTQREHVCLRK